MEPFNAGWLSLLPPAAAIVAALISREVISALLVGIFTGAVIYTSSTGGGVIIGSLDAVFSMMVSTLEFKILIFTSLLGAVVYLVSLSGGSKAYGEWAGRRMKTKRKSLLSACGLGCLVFIDDYFSCLFVGTVMKPLTDRCRVARAKLAWIVDSTAAPVCIIAPVGSCGSGFVEKHAARGSVHGCVYGGYPMELLCDSHHCACGISDLAGQRFRSHADR